MLLFRIPGRRLACSSWRRTSTANGHGRKGEGSPEGGGGGDCKMLPRWCSEDASKMRSLVLETRALVAFQRAVSRGDSDLEVGSEIDIYNWPTKSTWPNS